jgi:hypothetical protein
MYSLMRALFLFAASVVLYGQTVERWDVFETTLRGPAGGNPFTDVQLSARFQHRNRTVDVDGFYDGDGVYKVRFMPDTPGEWTWTTRSNRTELDGKTGRVTCTPASGRNHGPVRVENTYHFAYADGAPYLPFGTTSYAWVHQGDALEEKTLQTLRAGPFNKMRMCIFPKHYSYNANEPVYYPFPRTGSVNDYTRFNPEFYRHIEKRIGQLRDMGIEADLILFHPYDRWGYAKMSADVDDRYLRYTVARLSAFRNVWWSLANEFDFMKEKKMSDWDRFFRIVQDSDPYQHLRSIHNGTILYDHAKPWVTHASIQSSEMLKTRDWLAQYRKPVIFDECKYEGNIRQRWGNISARDMVRRFWLATVQGAYGGHGETYLDPHDILWWAKGGTLKGESPKRIAFLRNILEEAPAGGLNNVATYYLAAGKPGEYYLFYFDENQPGEYEFDLAAVSYRADLIDPWEMTVTPVDGTFQGKFVMKLPGKPYQAVRFRRIQ